VHRISTALSISRTPAVRDFGLRGADFRYVVTFLEVLYKRRFGAYDAVANDHIR
jgi:hypothetical protein